MASREEQRSPARKRQARWDHYGLVGGLAAGGLGWRHHILKKLDADPGRGLFISGTVVGLLGVASIIVGSSIGFADFGDPKTRSIIGLATSLGGSTFCNMGTAMLAKDSSEVQKVWKKMTTF